MHANLKPTATNVPTASGIKRGATLLVAAAVFGSTTFAPANFAVAASSKAVDEISRHFSRVPTMTGEFVQFSANGQETEGKFYLQRPGKIRFEYKKPSPIKVTSDGNSVVVSNNKLKTNTIYPLSKTPLKLLLSQEIKLDNKAIESIKQEADLTTVVMTNKSAFGNARIKMMFDSNNFDLRQWTITDDKGQDTSVIVFNVQKNVKLSPKLFKINYREIERQKTNRNSGGTNR